MDLMGALIAIGVIVCTFIAVYIISTFAIKEKTFEEAVAEQKIKTDELLFQFSKSGKFVKDKKHKKWGRKSKEKNDKGDDQEDEAEYVSASVEVHSEKVEVFKQQSEVVKKNEESKEESVERVAKAKTGNQKSKEVHTKGNSEKSDAKTDELKKEEAPRKGDDSRRNSKKEESKKKEEVEIEELTVEETVDAKKDQHKREDSQKKDSKKENLSKEIKNDDKKNNDAAGKVTMLKKPQKSASSDAIPIQIGSFSGLESPVHKKPKKAKGEFDGNVDVVLNGNRLANLVKNAILNDNDVQMLVDLLLNHKSSNSTWLQRGQKSDPVAFLQKQLQEKETSLEESKQLCQTATAKLKDVRQELGQERGRIAQMDRQLKQSDAEKQNIYLQVKQLQTDLNSLKQMKEENHKLKLRLTQLETELTTKKEKDGDVCNMQHEIDDLVAVIEQYKSQTTKNCELYDEQVKKNEELNTEMINEKAMFEKRLGTLEADLISVESEKNVLHQNLQTIQANYSKYESENAGLQQQLDEFQKEKNDSGDFVSKLQNQLQEAKDQLAKSESESSKCRADIAEAKQKLTDNTEELESLKKENEQLSTSVKTLKVQNNELINQKNIEESKLKNSATASETVLTEKSNEIKSLSISIKSQEDKIQELYTEIKHEQDKSLKLNEELAIQRTKNNDLREKNWKTIDALNAAEKLIADGKSKSDAKKALVSEQTLTKMTLQRIFPNIHVEKSNYDEWLSEFEKGIHLSMQASQEQLAEKSEKYSENSEKQQDLQAQVIHYQRVLTETEGILNKLQNSVDTEEHRWKQTLDVKEQELARVKELNSKLEKEKTSLETSLEQIRAAEEAASEMQEKLRELQGKLEGEENEKRSLETRSEESERTMSDLQEQLKTLQVKVQNSEAIEKRCSELVKNVDEMKLELEKEKKISKDLSAQTVKLNSLVKIGQDALNAEQEEVKSLQSQLELFKKSPATNGLSLNNSISEADNAPVKINSALNDSKKSKSKKRGASDK